MSKFNNLKWLLTAVVMIFAFSPVYSQRITVTGKVTDSQQTPLPGVAIVVKNGTTPIGTVTDGEGNYTIAVPNGESVLEASFLGYAAQEQKVGARTSINFVMQDDNILIDDIVVIGYGVQQKSHLTGSIAKLEGNVLADLPVSDVAVALQGQIPGLAINQNTSEVGVAPEIRVRGISSVGTDRSPLVVVDGFPLDGGLDAVNASDIQSIEVLKDAASAAIYGSRAANGVIMITTKGGVVDKPKYSVKLYTGFKYAYKLHDMLSMKDALARLEWEAAQEGNVITSGNLAQQRQAAWLEENLGYTDWQGLALRDPAYMNNVQFSIQGGKSDLKYYVSGSYTNDEGLMLQNEADKFNFRSKIDAKLSKSIKFGINLAGNYAKNTRPVNNFIDFYRFPSCFPVMHSDVSTSLTGYDGYIWTSQFNNLSTPSGPVDANGNPTWDSASVLSSSNPNPKYVMDKTERGSETYGFTGNLYLTVDLAPGLVFQTSNGLTYKDTPAYQFEQESGRKSGNPTQATYSSAKNISLLTENTLNYVKRFGDHDLNLLAGYTAQRTIREHVYISASGFPTDDIKTLNAATVFSIINNSGENKNGQNGGTGTFKVPTEVLESYLGRVNYSYRDRYLLSAAVRLDRSSLFAKGQRDAWFPSLSLGWRVSEEDFMKQVNWISSLKLRASYGVTGNNRINYDAPMELVSNAGYVLGSGNGAFASGLANGNSIMYNEKITWEQTNEWNVGFDWSLFSNKLTLTLDAYYSKTKALLMPVSISPISGFASVWDNMGKIQNKGLEVQANIYTMNKPNFKWETVLNYSMNRNKVLDLGGPYQIFNMGERSEQYVTRVGDPLVQYYGFKTMGVWNTQEEINENPSRSGDVVGGLRIVPTAGGTSITDADMVPMGNPYPDFTWSMTNNFSFHNFDVSFLFQGVQGITVLNGDMNYNESHKWNKAYIEDRWVSPKHQGNGIPAYFKKGFNVMHTDAPLEDASYVCLRNVTIGYTIPKKIVEKIRLSQVRVYVSGQNLLYFWPSGYRGVNPESRMTSGSYNNILISGYQRGGFPITSTVTFGLDFNF